MSAVTIMTVIMATVILAIVKKTDTLRFCYVLLKNQYWDRNLQNPILILTKIDCRKPA